MTSKEIFMNAIIEFLPVLFGVLIAWCSRFIKPLFLKNMTLVLLPVIAGVVVNFLSREGIGLVMVDILSAETLFDKQPRCLRL